MDVRLVAQRVAPDCLAAGGSLQALTGSLLGRRLDKGPQRSDWGAGRLDQRQVGVMGARVCVCVCVCLCGWGWGGGGGCKDWYREGGGGCKCQPKLNQTTRMCVWGGGRCTWLHMNACARSERVCCSWGGAGTGELALHSHGIA